MRSSSDSILCNSRWKVTAWNVMKWLELSVAQEGMLFISKKPEWSWKTSSAHSFSWSVLRRRVDGDNNCRMLRQIYTKRPVIAWKQSAVKEANVGADLITILRILRNLESRWRRYLDWWRRGKPKWHMSNRILIRFDWR